MSDERSDRTLSMNTNITRSYKDLVAQIRRAAVSIPSNIAEGQARHTTGEFIQIISHAEGSVAELDTQLILSIELKFCRDVATEAAFELIAELRRMLNVLRRKLTARH